ncbi:hypothetical protein SAMN05216490_0662 [Mucilaginibacter mallensis]|uniref:Uncharacterized protein n=1 Tax=Mucilaginibacter mallensis TaxID=652787 RepID=A0A1H1PZY9_MUCMA|nr:hypothetical protein [Mucilaginibacter mallensis]SDS16782.1 hypothetical protein SAMN05216490_0662 [Mucilaginibacter mallensis]
MIEKTLKTTDGNLLVKIPTALNEVTLGQMMEMQEKHYLNDIDAISILSGIPLKELNNVTNFSDFQAFGNSVHSLSNQIKYLYNSDAIPHKVTFMLGKRKVTVNVIRNLSVEPAGAFMAARDIIADEINETIKLHGEEHWQEHFHPSLKACCHLLAHYFFCRATGKKYDEYEAEEFCNEVKKLRVTEALPIAKHFFTCYPNLLKQKIGFFQRLHQYWRRRQVFRRLKNLNTSTR